MKREEALELLKKYLKNEKLIKHCLAVEAIMKAIAKELNEDENLYGLVGLLHDIDYEIVKSMNEHAIIACEILKDKLPTEALEAIKAHNELTNFKSESKLAIALKACDQISGLIIASALVMPNKKLEEVKLTTLMKKFKQKDFARNVNRNDILLCEKLGIKLERFMEISLNALKQIANELSL